jgi:hypothetical protein
VKKIRQEDQLGSRQHIEGIKVAQGTINLNTNPQHIKFRPNLVHKAKHQINYLAHQVHVMQDELKERSAQSKRTKRETYMKYGF